MADIEKIYHNIKSKAVNLKAAAEQLDKYPQDKRDKFIPLMREAAQDIIRLLGELEAQPRK
ncbi:MAG TPA: hypothetical protein PKI19_00090 [Elusimicrobiales bacterium]|nr:hypothetical protein [Elusimicrobiales bacterium]